MTSANQHGGINGHNMMSTMFLIIIFIATAPTLTDAGVVAKDVPSSTPSAEQKEIFHDYEEVEETMRHKRHHLHKEIVTLVQQRIEEIAGAREKCQFGEFLVIANLECRSCDEYCPNGSEPKLCGPECTDFFEIKKLQQEIQKLQNSEPGYLLPPWLWAVLSCVFTIVLLALIVTFGGKKVQKLLDKRKPYAYASNDTTPSSTLERQGGNHRENRVENVEVGTHIIQATD